MKRDESSLLGGLSLNENKERARKEGGGGVGNISLIAKMTTLFVWLLAIDKVLVIATMTS